MSWFGKYTTLSFPGYEPMNHKSAAEWEAYAIANGGTVTGANMAALPPQDFVDREWEKSLVIHEPPIIIPDYLPPSLNKLLGHWAKAARQKKECLAMVAAYGHKTARTTGKRRVRITLGRSGRRKVMDADNAKKALLDALVACKLLVDDSPEWCVCDDPVQVKDKTTWTQIDLENL